MFMGCGPGNDGRDGPAPPSSGTLVAVIGPSGAHPQAAGIGGGAARYFRQVPAVRGFCVEPTDGSATALLATTKRALEQRPAAVCIYIADPELARPSIDRIAADQVVLVTMGRRYDDPRVFGHVGVDIPDAAEQLAQQLGEIAGSGRTYLLVHQSGRSDLATDVYRRFILTASRKYGRDELRLLKQLPDPDPGKTLYDTRSQVALVEDLLGLFPHASLLVTLDPEVWLVARAGWERELRALNSGFRFVTLSSAPVLWRYLGTPEQPGAAAALVGPVDGDIGYAAVELAVQSLLAHKSPRTTRSIRCEVVTPQTLPEFARRYADAANGLDVTEHLPPGLQLSSQPAAGGGSRDGRE